MQTSQRGFGPTAAIGTSCERSSTIWWLNHMSPQANLGSLAKTFANRDLVFPMTQAEWATSCLGSMQFSQHFDSGIAIWC